MKRSETIGLVLMGTVAFGATFAGGAYLKSSTASPAPQAAASCTPGPGKNCEQTRRGFMPVPIPIPLPGKSAEANKRSASQSNTTRGGFGKMAQGSFRAGS